MSTVKRKFRTKEEIQTILDLFHEEFPDYPDLKGESITGFAERIGVPAGSLRHWLLRGNVRDKISRPKQSQSKRKPYVKHSAREWKRIIKDFLSSGLSTRDYADKHNLTPSAINRHMTALDKKNYKSTKPTPRPRKGYKKIVAAVEKSISRPRIPSFSVSVGDLVITINSAHTEVTVNKGGKRLHTLSI